MFKLPDWKLAWKLPLTIAMPSLCLVTALSVTQLRQASHAIEEDHRSAYTSYVHEKGAALERWLDDARRDVTALADSVAVTSAVTDFSNGWRIHGNDASADLRRMYITDNSKPAGQKDELTTAQDGSLWTQAHERHHVGLRSFQRARGYNDVFLFDTAGNLVYSVAKADDFALNFNNGKYADSGLGEVFKSGNRLEAGQMHASEIVAYEASAGEPVMFLSAPVFVNGRRAGVVAVQLPLETMQIILSESELLGESGEIYLVSSSGKALSNSRHEGAYKALDKLPDLEQIKYALSGEEVYTPSSVGAHGSIVISETYHVDSLYGESWGLVFEIDRAEAMKFVDRATISGIIEMAVTGFLLCFLVWYSVRRVIKRIGQLAYELEQIAAQNYDQDIVGQHRTDEVGFISKTIANLQVLLKEGAEAQAREDIVQKDNRRVVELLSAALMSLSEGDFRNKVLEFFPVEHKKLRYSINDALIGLNDVIVTVRETALNIDKGATEVAGAADTLSERTESQAATLEQTVAALEEVTTSVRLATEHVETVEITVETARSKAEESGGVVSETIEAMTEIEASSSQIAQIIGVIDDIAFQTNLLALNAGVEAARAGEAGRGFAVVASEVRGLAQRSADAAREIKTLIESSGQQVSRGVEMVGRTGEALSVIVGQVKDISGLVQQIAQTSREQSTALSEINTGISQLDQFTQRNAAMVEESTAASHLLRADVNKLIGHVDKFKTAEHSSGAQAVITQAPQPPALAAPAVDFVEEDDHVVAMAANDDKWTSF
ncbi:methyl-accepting chemotaxis protein [Epibacterium ulvae]|uniref:methyl-accepting chemotaxis protein n=1 Tax=Epibacterium ulvae TaxID=1156985 RepID=UPI001BFC88C1|nr:methyl-accepting chemotaxis protein [Epibacterium ulvae]MBT8153705.1 methyl-accepting chemotaxis protein [Epibacterium ulvae]